MTTLSSIRANISPSIIAATVNAATVGNSGAAIVGTLTGQADTAVTAQYVTGLTSANVTTALTYTPLDSNASVASTGTAQYVTEATQSNITAVGTLTGLTLSGTLTGTTLEAATIGNSGASLIGTLTGQATTAVTAQYVTGLTSANVTTALTYTPLDSNASVASAGTAQYVTQATQSNITSVGTLTALTVGGGLTETKVAMGASDIDLAQGNYFTKTISGTTTLTVSNVASSGSVSAFVLELTNGGSATVNWFSGVTWASATAPTLTSSGVDDIGFFTVDGGTTWRGLVLGQGMA